MSKRVAYDEPHYSGGNCRVTMTVEHAIAVQRQACAGVGLGPEKRATLAKMTDEDFLNDFLLIHHAEIESPKALARKFHDTYERLAPSFGYATREETRFFDPHSPNGRLMIAVCEELLRCTTL